MRPRSCALILTPLDEDDAGVVEAVGTGVGCADAGAGSNGAHPYSIGPASAAMMYDERRERVRYACIEVLQWPQIGRCRGQARQAIATFVAVPCARGIDSELLRSSTEALILFARGRLAPRE
jgi:hypothetical protein